mgnify:CR=1 FL=1
MKMITSNANVNQTIVGCKRMYQSPAFQIALCIVAFCIRKLPATITFLRNRGVISSDSSSMVMDVYAYIMDLAS